MGKMKIYKKDGSVTDLTKVRKKSLSGQIDKYKKLFGFSLVLNVALITFLVITTIWRS